MSDPQNASKKKRKKRKRKEREADGGDSNGENDAATAGDDDAVDDNQSPGADAGESASFDDEGEGLLNDEPEAAEDGGDDGSGVALQDADTPPRTDGKAPRRSADILPCPICFQRFDADALEGHVVNCISNDENTELQRRVRRDLDIARRLQDQIRADEEQARAAAAEDERLARELANEEEQSVADEEDQIKADEELARRLSASLSLEDAAALQQRLGTPQKNNVAVGPTVGSPMWSPGRRGMVPGFGMGGAMAPMSPLHGSPMGMPFGSPFGGSPQVGQASSLPSGLNTTGNSATVLNNTNNGTAVNTSTATVLNTTAGLGPVGLHHPVHPAAIHALHGLMYGGDDDYHHHHHRRHRHRHRRRRHHHSAGDTMGSSTFDSTFDITTLSSASFGEDSYTG